PKLGGVARRRFIRPAGVVPRTKSTSYRGSAQEPLFLVSPYRAHIRSAHYFIVSPYRAHIRSAHYFIVSPYRAHIRSAHARLRPANDEHGNGGIHRDNDWSLDIRLGVDQVIASLTIKNVKPSRSNTFTRS